MFNKIFKLILAFLSMIFCVTQFMNDNIGNGIALIFLSLTFILLYFKNEMLILAFLRMRKQDFDGTEKYLNMIKNPEKSLIKNNTDTTIIYLESYIHKKT
ncbi:MAG: hypothetical protein CM15mP101_08060 [Flavobacteriaceae bacterium]|nr:MAG: hypothetical protein CM15mP101_08060 [Flavobacteriaceae bacterium]